MVENTGTPHGAGRIRPLNTPQPIIVETDDQGRPGRVQIGGRWQAVLAVQDRWRIDDEWWRDEPVCRAYWQVRLESGRPVTVYCDLAAGGWATQKG